MTDPTDADLPSLHDNATPAAAAPASQSQSQSSTAATAAAQATAPAPSTTMPPPPPTLHAGKAQKTPTAAAASDNVTAAPVRPQTTRALNVSASPSPNSPLSSRDASPARPHPRSTTGSTTTTTTTTTTNPRAGLASRKSSTDVSPNRGPSVAAASTTVPSAAALQRALSATSLPQPSTSTSSSADPIKAPRPVKPASGPNSGDNTPHWPISPRLRSPPPPTSDARSGSRSRASSIRNQIKKPESQSTPAIVVQSSSPAPVSRILVREEATATSDPDEPVLSMKAPSRGASGIAPKLETVQESSFPAPSGFHAIEAERSASPTAIHKTSDEERNDVSSSKVTEDLSSKNSQSRQTGSGSDSGSKAVNKGKMQEKQQRSASTQRPSHITPKPSLSSLSTRSATHSSRNMTVETETVPSVAQSTISNQDRSASGRTDGSLRLKPSNETIRPKKERKAPKRKAPSINAGTGRSPHISYHYSSTRRPDTGSRSTTTSPLGSPVSYRSYDDRRSMMSPSPEMPALTHRPSLRYFYSSTNSSFYKASSKADVFEQKVASAVDEANSSDSDATFIYDSNQPEQQPHRSRHHHSRTPSMTSIASLADPRLAIRDGQKNPNKKNSMKFAPYNPVADPDAMERGDGTIRVGSGRAGGGSHHHHIGRHGQGRGTLGHLALDSDSPLSQSSRTRGPSSRHPSQPNSPRYHTFGVSNGQANGSIHGNGGSHSNGTKKYGEYSAYDMEVENVADDERTPLISSRSPRVRTPRRRNSGILRVDRRNRHRGGWCRRFAGCLVLSILLLVVIFSFAGLVFASTKPLTSVKVQSIQNVVVSQEELMLDLVVDAVNPNIIGVTVSDIDVSIFAKSKHVGSDRWWRHHGNGPKDDQEDWNPIDDPALNLEDDVVARGGKDEGNDPIEGEPRTMSLGRLFHFDSPLIFEGSFFARKRTWSIGALRLSNPGNKTEAGGPDRWEEVLQYPFELIVRGVIKYQLPLSTRLQSNSITASYYYDPDTERKKLVKVVASKLEEKDEAPLTHVSPQIWGRYDRRALPLLHEG